VKIMSLWDPLTRNFQDFVREVTIMRITNHHCVLPICGIVDPCGDAFKPAIVMPFMPNDSVAAYMTLMSKLPEWTYTRRYIICYGTALGMSALHALGVIHRDLKPRNILLDGNLDPKVCDFGLSKVMTEGSTVPQSHHLGTLFYQAPEVLRGDTNYTQAVDVYSFAITLFVILTGLEPYPSANHYVHTRRVNDEKKRPSIPDGVPKGVADLMQSCWEDAAVKRPTFAQVVCAMESERLLEDVNVAEFRAFRARASGADAAPAPAPAPVELPVGPSPFDVLKAQADGGDADAMFRIAQLLLSGCGGSVAADPAAAVEYYRRAAERGSAEGALAHALARIDGIGGPATPEERAAAFESLVLLSGASADDANTVEAVYQLGLIHRSGRSNIATVNNHSALRYFRLAAKKGHPEAEQHYAMCLDEGLGCAPDHELARHYYERSAGHASPRGMFRYAGMLLFGAGVAANTREAVRLFEQSAQHGCFEANFHLWGIFTYGIADDVPRDPVRAERYVRVGAAHGIVGCELEYADLLATGHEAEAERLRAHALEPRGDDAQITAGRLYESGLYFPENYERARALYEAAVASKVRGAEYWLGRLLLEKLGDTKGAAAVLRRGAHANDAQCAAYLGIKIREGRIERASERESRELLKGAALKNAMAAVAYGEILLEEQQPALARAQFERARNMGSVDGSEWMAKCYAEGIGINRNPKLADDARREAVQRRASEAARARGTAAAGLDLTCLAVG
jgi:TPR repeat protein